MTPVASRKSTSEELAIGPVRRFPPFVALVIFIALFASLGYLSGIFGAELSGETDEAAHFITALLARDYVLNGFPGDPFAYAANYYLHYPKVAIGHWPPLFYVLQGAWMLVFGPSPAASLILLTATTAVLAWLIFLVVRAEFGVPAGLACGGVFLLIPVIQRYGQMVMADMPVALAIVGGALAWARFMETERRRYAMYFAAISVAAILTKGNGFALAFVPPVAIALSGRWGLVRKRDTWLAAAIAGALTLPWTLATRSLVVPTMQHELSLEFLRTAGIFYFVQLISLPGWIVTALAIAGIASRVLIPLKDGRIKPVWASLFAVIVAVQIFHMLAPAGLEVRYLLPSVAVVCAFLGPGVALMASFVNRILPLSAGRGSNAGSGDARYPVPDRVAHRFTAPAIACAALIGFLATGFQLNPKRVFGYAEVGQLFSDDPALKAARRILSSAGADGEGLLVSEIVRRENARPGRTVVRGTQVFARMGWNGDGYQPLVNRVEDVNAVLNAIPADAVVVDRTPIRTFWPHEGLLYSALRSPDWQLAGVYPSAHGPSTVANARVEVYRWVGPPRGPSGLRVEMRFPKPNIVLDVPGSLNQPR